MTELFTPVANLKVGDRIKVVTNDIVAGSGWGDPNGYDWFNTSHKIIRFSKDRTKAYFDVIHGGDMKTMYVDNSRYPCIKVEKLKKSSGWVPVLKKIPDFVIGSKFGKASTFTDKQLEEAQSKASSWVKRNYASWPWEMKLNFQIEDGVLKTTWETLR